MQGLKEITTQTENRTKKNIKLHKKKQKYFMELLYGD